MAKRLRARFIVWVPAALGLALALFPSTATAADDHLACQLAHPKLVRAVFDLPHLKIDLTAISPTAPPPYVEAASGADISICEVRAWRQHPSSVSAFGVAPHWIVPRCCARLEVTTTVQDEGPEGAEYDPEAEEQAILVTSKELIDKSGGHYFHAFPLLGATGGAGFYYGSEPHIAVGFWRVNDSFLEIEVHAHQKAKHKLIVFAHYIVSGFMQYG